MSLTSVNPIKKNYNKIQFTIVNKTQQFKDLTTVKYMLTTKVNIGKRVNRHVNEDNEKVTQITECKYLVKPGSRELQESRKVAQICKRINSWIK